MNTKEIEVTENDRIWIIDVLRGVAILAILFTNIWAFAGFQWQPPEAQAALPTHEIDALVQKIITILVDTKFLGIFAMLFGFGFGILQAHISKKGLDFVRYFVIRMCILFLLACIHAYGFWFGDIIRFYAFIGLLLLLFRNCSEKALLRWALFFCIFATGIVFILMATVIPPYSYLTPTIQQDIMTAFSSHSYLTVLRMNWIIDPMHNFIQDTPIIVTNVLGRFLLGYWIFRKGIMQHISSHFLLLRKWTIIGLAVGFPASTAFYLVQRGAISLEEPWKIWIPFAITTGLTLHAIGYAGLLTLWCQTKIFKKFRAGLANVGRMAFTNYFAQTILALFLFYPSFHGLSLFGKIGPLYCLMISMILCLLQFQLSSLYLRFYRRGPIEKAWRSITIWLYQITTSK